ncbi:hypothetical protein ACFWIJ_19025 [Streptomyces sp. NPDC127079]|uniref:DUF4760 domain-containing protein n=1 Tax=Streptomyces sp. NPDC127079 TaxID=3347132 RepID=UPI00365CE8F8
MDSETLLVNVVTLLLSMTAIGVTLLLTLRQIRLMNNSNQLPLVLDLFREWRSAEFVHSEERLWADLISGEGADQGISGLEQPIRDDVYHVCAFYQMLAYLVAFRVVDEDLVFLATHYRILRTWETVRPYALAERHIRGDPYAYLNFFEDLAALTRAKSSQDVYNTARKRAYGRDRTPAQSFRTSRGPVTGHAGSVGEQP